MVQAIYQKKLLPFTVNVTTTTQKFCLLFLTGLYILVSARFWYFWLTLDVVSPIFYNLITLLLLWVDFMPLYFLFFVNRMKAPNPALTIPRNWRVAMVVTKAPSEPESLVKKTLLACLSQDYPHDTWLADEKPSATMKQFCAIHGIAISSREHSPHYHQSTYPRRTKCKEGNLAYFYDHFGYERYDFVSQLDADHVPSTNYLTEILKGFIDPRVAYVSAPSICSINSEHSSIARARLLSESTLHGPLQAGLANGFAPLCIGSHYSVRTAALRAIGGIGPELAEDHSTSLLFNAAGYRGMHALHAIAIGEGPPSFADGMTQEFQWSRSLFVLLFELLPKTAAKLPLRVFLQFLFSQLWYLFYSLSMVLGVVLTAYIVHQQIVVVSSDLLSFYYYLVPPTATLMLIFAYLKKMQILRPHDTPIFDPSLLVFHFVRFIYVLKGFFSAISISLLKREVTFRVTPKTKNSKNPFAWEAFCYCLLLLLGSSWIFSTSANSNQILGTQLLLLSQIAAFMLALYYILLEYLPKK